MSLYYFNIRVDSMSQVYKIVEVILDVHLFFVIYYHSLFYSYHTLERARNIWTKTRYSY